MEQAENRLITLHRPRLLTKYRSVSKVWYSNTDFYRHNFCVQEVTIRMLVLVGNTFPSSVRSIVTDYYASKMAMNNNVIF